MRDGKIKELEQDFPSENDEYSTKVIDKLVKAFTCNGHEAMDLFGSSI